jgi:hypothetical protein
MRKLYYEFIACGLSGISFGSSRCPSLCSEKSVFKGRKPPMSSTASETRLMSAASKNYSTITATGGAVTINMGRDSDSRQQKKIPHSEEYGDPYWMGTCYERGAAAQEWEIVDP